MISLTAALQEGVALLAPSTTALRDAELLLLHVTRLSKTELLTHPEREITDRQRDHYHAALARRAAREPVQHITGLQEFYGRPFMVNRLVLIPRPETEHLVEAALELAPKWVPHSERSEGWDAPQPAPAPRRAPHPSEARVGSILDVGAGSGILAITLALEISNATITATDISLAALAVAQQNAAKLGASGRIRFVQSDLFQALTDETYDIIVSNPPYIGASEELDPQVRDYEPPSALYAGPDGLSIYRRLIPAALEHLVPGGYLLLEIGHGQHEAVASLLEVAGFAGLRFINDLQQIPRVAIAQRPIE